MQSFIQDWSDYNKCAQSTKRPGQEEETLPDPAVVSQSKHPEDVQTEDIDDEDFIALHLDSGETRGCDSNGRWGNSLSEGQTAFPEASQKGDFKPRDRGHH